MREGGRAEFGAEMADPVKGSQTEPLRRASEVPVLSLGESGYIYFGAC